MKAMFESEKQKQDIKRALFHMKVWNNFEPMIIHEIIKPERGPSGDISPDKMSLEEKIRLAAVRSEKRKKCKNLI
jgi:hypothetical protein